jgi:hypothetical protein
MNLSSVREVKASLAGSGEAGNRLDVEAITPYGIPSRRKADVQRIQPSVALGVAPGKESGDYRLAVRVQHLNLLRSSYVERAVELAKGEADVRLIGQLVKRDDGFQDRQRPIRPGISVGHFRITAGTIGCLVERGRKTFILSNNHVLADENAGERGDVILQPGDADGGRRPRDVIAALTRFVRLVHRGTNTMDCALAELKPDVEFRVIPQGMRRHLHGKPAPPEAGGRVEKVGRTTGHTRGRVTAFEVDDVVVRYDFGNARFDGQIEIAGGRAPFSAGGDSGSLIFTSGDRQPYALLFAGSDSGGPSGTGVTYANPIGPILDHFGVGLLA